MTNFYLDKEYFSAVVIRTDHTRVLDESERIMLRLRGHEITSIRTEDHPKFAELREQLAARGYIKIERSYWNGDRVIKNFHLNDKPFKVGDMFPCAAAMEYRMK